MPNKSIYDLLCEGIAVNSKANVTVLEDQSFEFIGNKTECALLVFSNNLGYDYRALRESNKALQMNSFSSERKRMSTLMATSNKQRLHVKGASEIVLKRCDTYLDGEGNRVEMTSADMDYFNETIDNMADKALRTLALAYREFKEGEYNPEAVDAQEQSLTLIGIVGIEDPLRDNVVQSVADCHKAGIFVRMVTGDNIKTARKIAAQCGILTPDGIAIEGHEFAKLTDEQVDDILPRLQVMARSAPQDKYKLVHRLRMNNEVVSVTGDGTNDALALKEADVGLAMGIAGTAVAKQASDIIILDDNFVSIVKAVIWGRSVYDNIRKFLQFQLTVNLTALVVATIGAVSDSGTPLTAIQLLWVNFIMDTMASLALCTESPTPRLLDRRPYGRQSSLLSPIMIRNIVSQSVYQIAILVAALFAGAAIFNIPSGRDVPAPTQHYTFIFNTFVFMQIFNAFNSRRVNDERNIFSNLHRDWLFLVLIAIIIGVQVIITIFGGVVFTTVNMSWPMWISSIVLALLAIPLGYLFRLIPVPKEKFEREAIADEKLRQEARATKYKEHEKAQGNNQQIEAA
jgi:Ca2+-transporting ATPase